MYDLRSKSETTLVPNMAPKSISCVQTLKLPFLRYNDRPVIKACCEGPESTVISHLVVSTCFFPSVQTAVSLNEASFSLWSLQMSEICRAFWDTFYIPKQRDVQRHLQIVLVQVKRYDSRDFAFGVARGKALIFRYWNLVFEAYRLIAQICGLPSIEPKVWSEGVWISSHYAEAQLWVLPTLGW